MKTDSVTDYRYMFQANYKDTRKTLTETVLLSSLSWDFGQVFVSWDIFKNYLFKLSRILEDIFMELQYERSYYSSMIYCSCLFRL